jgi:signal transduction histidine kinase
MGQSLLARIRQSAEQMGGLLDDLLEYSRMNQAEIKLEIVNLQRAAQEAVALLRADIQAKSAVVTVAEPLPDVIGHPATVVLIINNLVSNALKFMAPGFQPQIRIWAEVKVVSERVSESVSEKTDKGKVVSERMSESMSEKTSAEPLLTDSLTHSLTDSLTDPLPGSRVRLWVEDNGIGIDQQGLTKLFNAFQRLHGKQAYPGTGLGLAIVRKGAERMGGHVGVESQPGQGSRFWIELPRPPARQSTAQLEQTAGPSWTASETP